MTDCKEGKKQFYFIVVPILYSSGHTLKNLLATSEYLLRVDPCLVQFLLDFCTLKLQSCMCVTHFLASTQFNWFPQTHTVTSQLVWNAAQHKSKQLWSQDGERTLYRVKVKVWPVSFLDKHSNESWFIVIINYFVQKAREMPDFISSIVNLQVLGFNVWLYSSDSFIFTRQSSGNIVNVIYNQSGLLESYKTKLFLNSESSEKPLKRKKNTPWMKLDQSTIYLQISMNSETMT